MEFLNFPEKLRSTLRHVGNNIAPQSELYKLLAKFNNYFLEIRQNEEFAEQAKMLIESSDSVCNEYLESDEAHITWETSPNTRKRTDEFLKDYRSWADFWLYYISEKTLDNNYCLPNIDFVRRYTFHLLLNDNGEAQKDTIDFLKGMRLKVLKSYRCYDNVCMTFIDEINKFIEIIEDTIPKGYY